MSYTAQAPVAVVPFSFPQGNDITQYCQFVRGELSFGNAAYTTGGLGSTGFQITDVSVAGVVTYSTLVGLPLQVGQKVVIFNTASNTNDGTYVVTAVAPTSATAGTFTIASPVGSHQATQTAQGVGQLQFAEVGKFKQTFTATAITKVGNTCTVTYTTLTGPQLVANGNTVTLAGFSNAGNNGTFTVLSTKRTSVSAGSFTFTNALGVASDSGTGTGLLNSGSQFVQTTKNPLQVKFETVAGSGLEYRWNAINQTVQIFEQGAANGATATTPGALVEYTTATALLLDVVNFEAVYVRA